MTITFQEAKKLGLTHIANADRKCSCCGDIIPNGSYFQQYREHALSHREAMHAGTYYPTRRRCASCVGRANKIEGRAAEVGTAVEVKDCTTNQQQAERAVVNHYPWLD